MPLQDLPELNFGDPSTVDGSLSERVRGLIGSEILKVAGEIRQMVRALDGLYLDLLEER